MDFDEEVESNESGDGSDDDIVEDLEQEEKNNKRDHSHVIDTDNEDGGMDEPSNRERSKKVKFVSEKEMKRLSKPATAEELNRLRETENLFHSNLFRLQIEEMLKEIQLKPKYKKEFQKWFDKFRSSVMILEDGRKRHDLADLSWLKQLKVKLPMAKLPQLSKGSYQFKKPLEVQVSGSYSLETMVGPKVAIDVTIEVPHNFYHKGDFINGNYHLKRALYLCDLISYFQRQQELIEDVHFISDGVDMLKPKIEVIPSGKLGKCVTVLLNIIVDKQGITLSRFAPSKNNVRVKWYFGTDDESREESNAETPTPFYNSTILHDLTYKENYKFVQDLLEPHRNIKDGIILLKIWLRQRELTSGVNDFSGFLIAILVAYLLQLRKLNSFVSSYQVIRTVFNYLVSSDWVNNGITLCKTNDRSIPTITQFHEHHKVVFIDTTGHHNLCYGMHSSTYEQIKHEAKLALSALDDANVNSFQILFMTSVPFYRHFDHIFTIHNDEALRNTVDLYTSSEKKLSHCGTLYPQLVNAIYDVLITGFRSRVKCLRVRQPQKLRWKPGKKFRHSLKLTFGLNLNAENYYLVVDKALESETSEFREFWGGRSELRRFQDGNITEAVVWDAKSLSEKRLICKQIVFYLMKHKFGLDGRDIHYAADQFDEFIRKDVEESTMKVVDVSNRLSEELRNMKNLPLDVVSVQGVSPVFRCTDAFPPTGTEQENTDLKNGKGKKKKYEKMNESICCAPPYISPIQMILHMGATNKWPQDLNAIRRLRAAFYLKIATSLTNHFNITAVAFPDKIVARKEGFVFHLKIFCPNEIGLLKQIVEDGLIKYRDNEMSLAAEREMTFLPRISSALHGLYEQYSSFGPACCMVKRWVNSQMIDPFHISEEVLDMLVASLYLKPMPHETPLQPQVAFLRFLQLMARTDWNAEYVVLNINNELTRQDILDIESHFTANRDTLPALFLATPYDRTRSLYTKDCPTVLILLRLVQLCGNALQIVESRIYTNIIKNEFGALFECVLDPYNIIIHLNQQYIPRRTIEDENKRDANGEIASCPPIPVNGFDPVAIYVKELREAYDDVALFFYNAYGGSEIGCVWRPEAASTKDFKVQNMARHTYNEKSGKLSLTKELIVEDFMIIGKGLVKSVDVKENGNLRTFTYL